MAATTSTKPEQTAGTVGRVIAITGPVVDVEFPAGQLPAIYNAVTIDDVRVAPSPVRCSSTSATTGSAPWP